MIHTTPLLRQLMTARCYHRFRIREVLSPQRNFVSHPYHDGDSDVRRVAETRHELGSRRDMTGRDKTRQSNHTMGASSCAGPSRDKTTMSKQPQNRLIPERENERLAERERQQHQQQRHPKKEQLSTEDYRNVMQAYSKAKRAESGAVAENLLRRMVSLGISADILILNQVLHAFACSAAAMKHNRLGLVLQQQQKSPSQCAEQFLSDMDCRFGVTPNVASVTTVIHALASEGRVDGGERAEDLLRWVDSGKARFGEQADTFLLNAVLYAHASSQHPHAAKRAQSLYETRMMLQPPRQQQQKNERRRPATSIIKPDATTWNCLIMAWSKSGDSRAPEFAVKMLKDMETNYRKGISSIPPTVRTYSAVLQTWAKSGRREAPEQAMALLKRLMEKQATHTDATNNTISGQKTPKSIHVVPTTLCFDSVMDCWARSGLRGAARQVERLLQYMTQQCENPNNPDLQPSIRSYAAYLMALSNSREPGSAEQAESVLNDMKLRAQSNPQLYPNVVCYTTVISAWSHSRQRHAPQRALRILREMMKGQPQQPALKPNVYSFTSVINAFASSRDPKAPQQAMDLLDEMVELYESGKYHVKPTQVTLNAVLNVFCQCDTPEIAEVLLLQTLPNNYSAQPNVFAYTSVIAAWARQGNGERAEALLECLQDLYQTSRSKSLKPNVHTYTSAIHAWAIYAQTNHESRPDQREIAAQRVEALFRHMQSQREPPNHVTYNACLLAYLLANTDEYVGIATELFDHMMQQYQNGRQPTWKPDRRVVSLLSKTLIQRGKTDITQQLKH